MADSVPLDTAVDLVPIPGVRLKNVPKGVSKAVLSDDVKLKLAAHQFGGSKACTTYFRKEKQTACV